MTSIFLCDFCCEASVMVERLTYPVNHPLVHGKHDDDARFKSVTIVSVSSCRLFPNTYCTNQAFFFADNL